jgi:hypothetical protein
MRDWLLLWGLLSALLMAFGSVGPWLQVKRVFSGGVQDGYVWLVMVLAVVGAVLLIAWRQRWAAGFVALVAGVVGVGIALYDRSHWGVFLSLPHLSGAVFVEGPVHLGWGLYLTLFASLGFAVCGLVWLVSLANWGAPLK